MTINIFIFSVPWIKINEFVILCVSKLNIRCKTVVLKECFKVLMLTLLLVVMREKRVRFTSLTLGCSSTTASADLVKTTEAVLVLRGLNCPAFLRNRFEENISTVDHLNNPV